jgi:hypothetical protein
MEEGYMTSGIQWVSAGMMSILVAAVATACSGQGDSNKEALDQVQQGVVTTNCQQPIPATPINFDRELLIRSLYVVDDGVSNDGHDEINDHCRTTWGTSCSTSMSGRWTFGYMMAAMAGTSDVTSTTARQFVRDWLKRWLTSQQPNIGKAAVAPRTAITETLINPWLAASNCPSGSTLDTCLLDLKRAPFRLLAFVNRIDLPAIPGYSTGSGEFRVVFGAIGFDPINCATCSPDVSLQATVILEYNLPNTKTLQQWATMLHDLSSWNPENLNETSTYRTRLQTVTDAIVGPNAAPNAHNGNAISHVRTNEISFDCNMGTAPCNGVDPDPTLAEWEFRQFKLNGSDFSTGVPLVQDTVSQTPQSTDNLAAAINSQLINNRTAILGGDPVFPDGSPSLGNSSHSPPGIGAILWEKGVLNSTSAPEMTSAMRAQTRHQFGFGTCNGCHYPETSNQVGLFHVAPREAGVMSEISSFLSVGGASDPLASSNQLAPTSEQTVSDPAGSRIKFQYHEPWRRACEIRRILTGSPTTFTKPTGHLK